MDSCWFLDNVLFHEPMLFLGYVHVIVIVRYVAENDVQVLLKYDVKMLLKI
jgi:hypothetical protein